MSHAASIERGAHITAPMFPRIEAAHNRCGAGCLDERCYSVVYECVHICAGFVGYER